MRFLTTEMQFIYLVTNEDQAQITYPLKNYNKIFVYFVICPKCNNINKIYKRGKLIKHLDCAIEHNKYEEDESEF